MAPDGATARSKAAVTAEVGIAIPFNRYLDVDGADNQSYRRVENGPGFALQTSVVLDGWDFHYGLTMIRLGAYTARVSDRLRKAAAQLGQDIPEVISGSWDSFLSFHLLTVGYRFHVLDRNGWRLFFPNGVGVTAVTGEAMSRPLLGAAVTGGFGAEWRFSDAVPWLELHGSARYQFSLTDTSQRFAGSGFIVSSDVWKSAFAMLHSLTITFGMGGSW